MLRKLWLPLTTLAVLAAAFIVSAQAPAQEKGGGGKGGGGGAAQAIVQIKPGFYEVTGAGGNTSVRVTNDGVIVVDTKNLGDANYDALMAQIRTVTDKPVKYVIATHVHQDHSGNIGKFMEAGAEVIVHENLNKNLETYAGNAQGQKPPPAKVTYTTSRTIKLGTVEAQIYHFSRAHTSGDSVVYFPDLKIVAGGDSIVSTAPNIDFPNGGSLVEWPKLLEATLKLDFDTCIPGHGNVMTKAEVQAFKTKWETLISRGAEQVKKGTPKDQLLASIKTDDIGWNITGAQWSAVNRLDPFYDELSKVK